MDDLAAHARLSAACSSLLSKEGNDTTRAEYKAGSGGLARVKIRVTIQIIYVPQNSNRQPR